MIILEHPPMDKDGAMNDDKIKKLKEMCKKHQANFSDLNSKSHKDRRF